MLKGRQGDAKWESPDSSVLTSAGLAAGWEQGAESQGHFSLEPLKRTNFLTAPPWVIIVMALPLPPVAVLGQGFETKSC